MSISGEKLTYGQKLEQEFPAIFKPDNIWSLICVGDNLDDPVEGWSGFVLAPVFAQIQPFELFFGNMPEALMSYENIAEFSIRKGVTKSEAYRVLRDILMESSNTPVIISSNAHTWVKPVINTLQEGDTKPLNPVFICLRDLFSAVMNKLALTENPFELFQNAPKLPQKKGLYAIAEQLGVKAGLSSNKATHRCKLTSECVKKLLENNYPGSEDDDEV